MASAGSARSRTRGIGTAQEIIAFENDPLNHEIQTRRCRAAAAATRSTVRSLNELLISPARRYVYNHFQRPCTLYVRIYTSRTSAAFVAVEIKIIRVVSRLNKLHSTVYIQQLIASLYIKKEKSKRGGKERDIEFAMWMTICNNAYVYMVACARG